MSIIFNRFVNTLLIYQSFRIGMLTFRFGFTYFLYDKTK